MNQWEKKEANDAYLLVFAVAHGHVSGRVACVAHSPVHHRRCATIATHRHGLRLQGLAEHGKCKQNM